MSFLATLILCRGCGPRFKRRKRQHQCFVCVYASNTAIPSKNRNRHPSGALTTQIPEAAERGRQGNNEDVPPPRHQRPRSQERHLPPCWRGVRRHPARRCPKGGADQYVSIYFPTINSSNPPTLYTNTYTSTKTNSILRNRHAAHRRSSRERPQRMVARSVGQRLAARAEPLHPLQSGPAHLPRPQLRPVPDGVHARSHPAGVRGGRVVRLWSRRG